MSCKVDTTYAQKKGSDYVDYKHSAKKILGEFILTSAVRQFLYGTDGIRTVAGGLSGS